MSRGIGKLQRAVLEVLDEIATGEIREVPSTRNLYGLVQSAYWDERIAQEQYKFRETWGAYYRDEDKPELNRRRASIAQAITSLKKRSLIGYLGTEDLYWITDKGKETIRIK